MIVARPAQKDFNPRSPRGERHSIYDYMLDQVKKEVNGFYAKYASTEGITMAEAKKRVAEADVEEYERKAKKYVEEQDFSTTANQEIRLYNLTMKVNRLQLLEANIGLETVSGFDELSKVLGSDLTERAVQEMARQAGILGMTVKDSAKAAASIVGASFHNATFSDRIWMYQAQLRDELDSLLRSGLIQGYGPLELARHIDKLFDSGRYNAERLLRTELTRVQSDAQLQSLTANGFDEYQFNALGDACPACAALDEKHFKIADMQVGENAPPVHPRCRCSISAYADDASYNEWLDSYPNHGLSFEEWKRRSSNANTADNDPKSMEKQQNVVENDADSGTIQVTKTVSGHSGTPKKAAPGSVIDHVDSDGRVDARSFYGDNGLKNRDIHTSDHGNPKTHQFGENGEHAHDYEWDANENLKDKTIREISDDERKENGDIL